MTIPTRLSPRRESTRFAASCITLRFTSLVGEGFQQRESIDTLEDARLGARLASLCID